MKENNFVLTQEFANRFIKHNPLFEGLEENIHSLLSESYHSQIKRLNPLSLRECTFETQLRPAA